MPRRRRMAAVVAIVGVLFVANHLREVWPRNVSVAYEVGHEVRQLAVDYLDDHDAVVSVRFRRSQHKPRVFEHTVRLQPGTYQVHMTLYGPQGHATEQVRHLHVPASGLTRFDLHDALSR